MKTAKFLSGFLPSLLLCTTATVQALEVGDLAPEIVLRPLHASGEQTEIRLSDYRGKVVYVDFWASWCPPCLVSIPLMNELRNRYVTANAAFEVLAVNVDSDPEAGIEFLLDEPVDYVVLGDAAGKTPALYAIEGMPTSFLIDAEGRIQLVHEGFRSSDIELIEAEVRKLLAE